MTRFRIEDFPPHIQDQIRAQIQPTKNPSMDTQTEAIPPTAGRKHRWPNKTELNYRHTILREALDVRFEAMTFRMSNGHRYTPDWVVFEAGLPIACHECKGGYALHSQQRASLAFDQCAKEFPTFQWVWAVKTAEGWRVTHA